MDVLKAAHCRIDTMMDPQKNVIFVVYVPLAHMEDL